MSDERQALPSSAEVLQGQLEDVLIKMDLAAIRQLDRITLMEVFDWVERVKVAAPQGAKIPAIPSCVKGWCNDRQLNRQWQAFTKHRPNVKSQGSLFSE